MRGPEFAERVFAGIAALRGSVATDLRHQLRFEIAMLDHYPALEEFVARHGVEYLVFNDHLPHEELAKGKRPPRLTGQALTKGGFDQAFDRAITLDVQCFGSWCASAVPGTEYLGFLERRDGGYVLTVDPCGGMGHPDPTPAMLDKALECLQGGPCMRTRR